MKRKNYLYILGVTVLLCSGCDNANRESKTNVKLPELDAIDELQLNLTRISADDYPNAKLADLAEDIESAEQVDVKEAEKLHRPEDYLTITLGYEDDSQDTFYFFQYEGEWYMETEAGVFYRNAEFVQDYISQVEVIPESGFSPEPEFLRLRLGLEDRFDTLDTKYEFVLGVQTDMQFHGMTEEEAIVSTRASLMEKYQICQYALQGGIEISDEELDQILNQYQEAFADDAARSEYQPIYEEAGTTLQESLEKNRELIRIDKTIKKLYQKLQNDFRNGQTKVGNKDCKDVNEYYQIYVEDVVKSSIEETERNKLEKSLDDAERYYKENKAELEKNDPYTDPESLIWDFLNEYLNVSLEQATDQMQQLTENFSVHIVMEDAFTSEGIEQVTANRYPLMMEKLAVDIGSDIIIEEVEINPESDSETERRYSFCADLDYPMADNDTVTDEIKGYFDVQFLDNEWKIDAFMVRSFDGSYPLS